MVFNSDIYLCNTKAVNMTQIEVLTNDAVYGESTGAKLVIGFTEVYYTLWRVTQFAKVENCFYLQNLSMSFEEAQRKASEMIQRSNGYFGHDFEVDLDLRGENGRNYFRPLAAKRYESNLLAFSRFAGRDMRSLDMNEEYFYCETRYGIEHKKMAGLAWATYLNEDEKTFRGLRRRVIARECLVAAGLLVKVEGDYITPKQIAARRLKAEREAAINGHHEEDGKRITLNIKKLGNHGSFETQFGTTYIVTLLDDNNRLFKYMGSKLPEIGEDGFIEVKATIKHDIYKDQPETKLQRIKIL